MKRDRIKVTLADIERRPEQGGLFDVDGNETAWEAWREAAELWAAERQMTVERVRVGQQARIGGVWYRIEWDADAGEWQITKA